MKTNFEALFRRCMGDRSPYPYQIRLALESWPDVLHIPTGLGKTAAVVLAWLHKRGYRHDGNREEANRDTPRRLVLCLPMRVLVEQTAGEIRTWLDRLGLLGDVGQGKVSVHVLMGGSEDVRRPAWAAHPEEDAVIIGTQDMLLSRALMRGYGMSRYQWPVHFALLHNDALWVYDEVQLMGAGLPTSTQLEAFRRDVALAPQLGCRSLWVSATLNREWLGTVDFLPHLGALTAHTLTEADQAETAVRKRLQASKLLRRADTVLDADSSKQHAKAYIEALAAEIAASHQPGTQTLVILNRVERAQDLYRQLGKRCAGVPRLLLHARFRPTERARIEAKLRDGMGDAGRIVIATQAIEAGVDMSSRVLFTELAPWASLVQRFGRCNRAGEHDTAEIRWINIATDAKLAPPYDDATLASARTIVDSLDEASSAHLPDVDAQRPLTQVLRRRDLLELFNTDPDLSGYDVDIAPYIRDSGTPPLHVFWRDFEAKPAIEMDNPVRNELCPASIGQVKDHLGDKKRGAWRLDTLDGHWKPIDTQRVRPGMTLLLRADEGGYDPELGFVPGHKVSVTPIPPDEAEAPPLYDGDPLTQIGRWVPLPVHLTDVAADASALCQRLQIDSALTEIIVEAGRWHDLGKAHEAFQRALAAAGNAPDADTLWAKSDGRGRLYYKVLTESGEQARKHFRHELASMLAWLQHGPRGEHHDLIAFLIAAHHGKVRMGLRALPNENEPPQSERLYARGVWDGDTLPALRFDGRDVPATTLHLDVMQLGESTQGLSWTARTQRLLQQHGPFRLAWLEALVRIADWRASRREQQSGAVMEDAA